MAELAAPLMQWNKFVIKEEPFAEGSFGEIYLGKWAEQNVVLKRLKGLHLSKDVILKEINTLTRLHNKHVVLALGATMDPDGKIYLVMEYSKNGSLYRMLHLDNIPLRREDVLQIGLDVAKGLAYLHANDPVIIHRDIKSDNILLFSNKTRAKLSDFGTARFLEANKFAVTDIGTLGYIAPEILDHKNYTEKVDVYSFGVVLFEMLCKGRLATSWEPRRDKIVACVKDKELQRIILWCCKHNPDDRPSMNQMVVELRKILKAEQALNASLSIQHRQTIALSLRHQGKVKIQAGDYEGALKEFKRANKLYIDPDTLTYQATAKIFLGDIQSASDDLQLANELQPNDPFTLQQLTVIKFHYKGLDAVLEDVERIKLLNSTQDEESIMWQRLKMLTSVQNHSTDAFIPFDNFSKIELSIQLLAEWKGQKVLLKFIASNKQYPFLIEELSTLVMLHPNKHIVNTLGIASDGNGTYFITEYIEGSQLSYLLYQQKVKLSQLEVIQIALDVANGLKYLHEQKPKIVYAVLRSSRILVHSINGHMHAKITSDFNPEKSFAESNTFLPDWIICMAPEVAIHTSDDNVRYDESSDVYSFGHVLFEMLTQKRMSIRAWEESFRSQEITAKIGDRQFRELILACCKDDPKKRPQISHVVEVLEVMNKKLQQ